MKTSNGQIKGQRKIIPSNGNQFASVITYDEGTEPKTYVYRFPIIAWVVFYDFDDFVCNVERPIIPYDVCENQIVFIEMIDGQFQDFKDQSIYASLEKAIAATVEYHTNG